MASNAFDWFFRVVMLVLAGLVTLSILGSIAAMSNEGGPGAFAPGDRPLVEAEPAGEPEARAPVADPEAPDGSAGAPAAAGGDGVMAAAATATKQEERWLEAIAYALLALAGLGAIGLLMLWGVLRELRRIGDALVSSPPPP